MFKTKKAFWVVEIIVWITIVSIVIISWFQAYSKVMIWKISLIEKTSMQKDSFYFTEKLFQLIKEWWTIDYEEYFNRKVVWTITSSWHYLSPTWFWNFWKWWNIGTSNYWNLYYYCRSMHWVPMWINWCFNNNWSDDFSANIDWTNFWAIDLDPQRYWQYSFQFIDYNSNASSNLWDENWNWIIVWDDDDEFLWLWPVAFEAWVDLKEIYLISWDKKTRTLIRWNVKQDPYAPVWNDCTMTWSWYISTSSDWCLWTIEFLKLEWQDWWMNHDSTLIDTDWTQYDWVIDTWIIDRQFTWWDIVVAWSNSTNYWQPLFPENIHVSDFRVFMYPNIDPVNSWKSTDSDKNISPYLVLNFKIKPSWKTRIKLRNEWRELNFTTTINLTDIYSN